VQVFDHGLTSSGAPYIVMELLEGKDLGAHIADHGRMDPTEVVALVIQIGKALSKAHKAGIVHRDIKPDNIFLCDTDSSHSSHSSHGQGGLERSPEIFVKLLDFGTAKREARSGDAARTTMPGQIMGTPYYMSPEQSVGAELDERSDIWSLGVVVFEALTGRKPFDGTSIGAITVAIHGPRPTMSSFVPELPTALDDWFARACAQLPQDRFASIRGATSAFVEAVTGSAPIDQPTESVYFPPVKAKNNQNEENNKNEKGGSTPVRPVTRRIEPLIASLPERGSERRVTTIAAGIVMAGAAIAMIAIVLNRSPSPPAVSAQPEAPPTTHAAEVPSPPQQQTPPTAPTAPPSEPEPSLPAETKAAAAPAHPVKAPPAPRTNANPNANPNANRHASAPPPPLPAPGRKDSGAAAAAADDDLARLTKAAAKHQPDPAPTLSPPPVPSPPPSPSPSPSPSPTPKPETPAPPPLPAE
jgi:serine/threonine protein kinase